jgi:hypothetical protein
MNESFIPEEGDQGNKGVPDQIQSLSFPELFLFEDYNGDFNMFNAAVYEQFQIDFIDTRPYFLGQRLGLKLHPIVDGKECTYYHITHEGADEATRTPDIRRMERIRFPKFIINSCPHNDFKIWKNQRGRDTRTLIFNEAESYLIVLSERKGGYLLLWTAYLVKGERRRNELLKEYNAYINANAAQQG